MANDDDEPGDPPSDGLTAPAEPARPPRRERSPFIVGAVALAVGSALAVLNALGYASGLVITVLGVIGAVAGSALTIWETLRGDLKGASRRRRVAYPAGVLALALMLVGLGVLLRPAPELPRLPGTTDVAIVGLLAEHEDEQGGFDDVATSLERALPASPDGEVKSYASIVRPPLGQLGQPVDERPELDAWVSKFLAATDAELLIAGYEDGAETAQPVLHVAAYVPFAATPDAPELSGWLPVTDYLLDRDPGSSRAARADLVSAISARLGGLAGFLDGLDALENGKAADAVAALGPVIKGARPNQSDVLRDLARLYRGHAYETRAEVATSSDRNRLLDQARHDYEAVPSTSVVAARARLSLAMNGYLRAARSGCTSGARSQQLRDAARTLQDVAIGADSVVSLKARINRAQVLHCLSQAGDRRAAAELREVLDPLLALPLPDNDAQIVVKRQVKSLALSIDAQLLANESRLADAIQRLDQAIELEQGRLERRAVWLGLVSVWLLKLCRVSDGEAAQQQSLAALQAAADRSRVPQSEVGAYAAAYATDLADARRRCGASGSGSR